MLYSNLVGFLTVLAISCLKSQKCTGYVYLLEIVGVSHVRSLLWRQVSNRWLLAERPEAGVVGVEAAVWAEEDEEDDFGCGWLALAGWLARWLPRWLARWRLACGWLSCLVWLWLWLAEVKTNVLDMYAVLADEADEVIILVCLNLELGTSLF